MGLLTKYPIETGVFDWAIASGKFKPKPAKKLDAAFIGQFTTQRRWHTITTRVVAPKTSRRLPDDHTAAY